MTRQKKIERDKQIKTLLFLYIQDQGYFYWHKNFLFLNVARALNCSIHKVKRVFWKDVYINHLDWLLHYSI